MPVVVTTSFGPPDPSWTIRNDDGGTSNVVYTGWARSYQDHASTITVSAVSTANPAVFTATAHGLSSGQYVIITGATGSWAALNSTGAGRVITVVDANSFSVAVNSTGFTGSFDGTVTTYAPRTNSPCWSILRNTYGGTGGTTNLIIEWAQGSASSVFAWDSRTTYGYQ